MSVEAVAEYYVSGKIVAVYPNKDEPNFEMYDVVRRLKSVDSGAIINHFFRCVICEQVLNVITAYNYATLARHFEKCTGPGRCL